VVGDAEHGEVIELRRVADEDVGGGADGLQAAYRTLDSLVLREALVMTFNDIFVVLTIGILLISPLALLLPDAVRTWDSRALPILKNYVERDEHLPPCLCMSLACLIMLFAGARREEDGRYTVLKNGERCFVSEDEEILSSFSRLSCDMPPESLAYAALSDRAIWEEDLREIPGLEEMITEQLRDLQLLGLLDALAKAWKHHE
jgi:hypothetical protein